jgi:ubiquinone/menaquinone biosynthesis C-methylase UbiE
MVQAKAYKGMGMEGGVARWYDKTTRKDLPEFKALARRVAQSLPPGAKVLEVAPGPGFFAIELAKIGRYEITGLDISKSFVEIARRNAQQEQVQVDFRQGNASAMPFPEGSFDFLLCRAAFKNFSDPVGALREMYRVLTPGGRALLIDLRKDVSKGALDDYIHGLGVGALDAFMMKWTFRLMLIRRAYTKQQFERFIAEGGFGKSEIQETPIGFEITLVK